MKLKFIGSGAAGNKGCIELIEEGLVKVEDVLLINSTSIDIPENYKNIAFIFKTISGCGKETSIGRSLTLEALQDTSLANALKEFVTDDVTDVVVVTSTEGGTGCGSTPIICSFLYDVIKVNVNVVPLTGFEDDLRGMQNTLEFFQSMKKEYNIMPISNKKFLSESNNNQLEAIRLANKDFASKVSVMLGKGMIESEQNMDKTDLEKCTTEPGFMIIEKRKLNERYKTTEEFNNFLIEVLDDNKSIEINQNNKKMSRLGVIINAKPETQKIIDYSFNIINQKFGACFESFKHVQYNPEVEEFVAIILQGLAMPLEEITNLYKRYEEDKKKLDMSDSFFDEVKKFSGSDDVNTFNAVASRRQRRRNTSDSDMDNFLNRYRNKDKKDEGTLGEF